MPNSYQQAGAAADNLGQSLSRIALGLAQQRSHENQMRQTLMLHLQQLQMQKERNQAQAEMEAAHTKTYANQAALYEAQRMEHEQKTKDAQTVAQHAGSLGDTIEALGSVGPENPMTQSFLQNRAVGLGARLAGMGNQHAVVNASQGIEALDPLSRRMIATGTKLYTPVGHQGGVFDAYSGGMTMSPQTLGQGQKMVSGQTGQEMAQGLPKDPSTNYTNERRLASLQALVTSLQKEHVIEGDPLWDTFTSAKKNLDSLLGEMNGSGTGTSQPWAKFPGVDPAKYPKNFDWSTVIVPSDVKHFNSLPPGTPVYNQATKSIILKKMNAPEGQAAPAPAPVVPAPVPVPTPMPDPMQQGIPRNIQPANTVLPPRTLLDLQNPNRPLSPFPGI